MSINNYYSRFKKEKESLVCTSCVSFFSFTYSKKNCVEENTKMVGL